MQVVIKGKFVEARVVRRLSLNTNGGGNHRPYDVEYEGKEYRVWDDEGDGRAIPGVEGPYLMGKYGLSCKWRGYTGPHAEGCQCGSCPEE